MADLDLRPERRDQLAAGLRAELEALIPGSATDLRGSLASGTADPYSDIDLCWVVGDKTFTTAVSAAAELAVRLPSVQAVRIDPGLARSPSPPSRAAPGAGPTSPAGCSAAATSASGSLRHRTPAWPSSSRSSPNPAPTWSRP
jgi:hypothetical protein